MDRQKTALYRCIEDLGRQIKALGDPKNRGYQYASIYELVADQGRPFTARPLPPAFEKMSPKECFRNASIVAIRHAGAGIMYCEGYVNTLPGNIVPILHAWCIDRDENIIDPTLAYQPHIEYIGIPFDLRFMLYTFEIHKAGSLLDDWKNGWPLLKDFKAHRR